MSGPNGAANASDDPQNKENKLLNKLLKFGKKKDGSGNRPPSVVFETGSDVNGCTQGIWMYICDEELHDKVVVFLDCEGLGRDRAHDSKLMAMAMLMSSVLIYNSKVGWGGVLLNAVMSLFRGVWTSRRSMACRLYANTLIS